MALPGYQLPYSSYEPHPSIPGAYNFTPTGGGSPYMFAGPGAQQMAGMIDQMPPQADMRTANRAGSTVTTPFQGDPEANMPAGPSPVASDATQAPGMQVAGQTADREGAAAAALAQDASAPLPGAPAAKPAQGAATTPAIAIDPYKHVSAVNPVKMARNAVAVPATQTVTAEGGVQDPELAAHMKQLGSDQIAAQQEEAKIKKDVLVQQGLQLQADQALAAKQQIDSTADIAAKSAALDIVKDEGTKRIQIAQQDLDAENNKQVDSYALFRGRPGAQIAAALAGALGAFGSAFTHGPNFALDIINRNISDNIAEQNQNISRGQANARNDLSRIMDTYKVDKDDATNILKLAYQKKVDAQARERAATMGTQQAQLAYAAIQPQLLAQQAATEKSISDSVLGKVSVTQNAKMVQPSAGGTQPKTLKEIVEEKELNARGVIADQKVTHGGVLPKAGAAAGKLPARIASMQINNHSAQEDIVNLKKEMAKNPGWIAPGAHIPLVGDVGTNARLDRNAIVAAIVGKAVAGSNGSINESEMHEFKAALGSGNAELATKTADRILEALKTADKAIEEQRGGVQGAATADEEGGSEK